MMEQEIYFGRTERGNNNFIQPKDRFFKNPAIALYIKRIIGLECFDKMTYSHTLKGGVSKEK